MFQPFGVSDRDLWEPPKKNQVVEVSVEMMENPTVCKGRVGVVHTFVRTIRYHLG